MEQESSAFIPWWEYYWSIPWKCGKYVLIALSPSRASQAELPEEIGMFFALNSTYKLQYNLILKNSNIVPKNSKYANLGIIRCDNDQLIKHLFIHWLFIEVRAIGSTTISVSNNGIQIIRCWWLHWAAPHAWRRVCWTNPEFHNKSELNGNGTRSTPLNLTFRCWKKVSNIMIRATLYRSLTALMKATEYCSTYCIDFQGILYSDKTTNENFYISHAESVEILIRKHTIYRNCELEYSHSCVTFIMITQIIFSSMEFLLRETQ